MCSIDIDSHQLPLIANLLEKVVAKQLIAVLDKHSLFDKFQSSFQRVHSTETALLKVSSDIFMSNDAGKCSVLLCSGPNIGF